MTPEDPAHRRFNFARLAIWTAAAFVIAAGAIRYFNAPSFWLDEAFVAVSLRNPTIHSIFARLEYGQLFPRFYLAAIAGLRQVFGYHIWILRLLPSLSFLFGTVLWARVLSKRAGSNLMPGLLAAVLLLGATQWLDQSIQLKQYTIDVMLALVPFTLGDDFFEKTLAGGRKKPWLAALALPCLLSYTYPIALGARVAGWYVYRSKGSGWSVRAIGVVALVVPLCAAMVLVWFTDYRFNIEDNAANLNYWNDCILRASIRQGPRAALSLVAKFLWGWHGRMPVMTAVIVPLQIAGVYRVVSRWRRAAGQQPEESKSDSSWGSRTVGSLVLLVGVLIASLLFNYPICGGRVVLFTQIHTQIPAIEGAFLVLGSLRLGRWRKVLLWSAFIIVVAHTGRRYSRFILAEPAENLRPVVRLIDPAVSNTVWVHPCSVAQVRSLPDKLPVERVLLGNTQSRPPRGEKIWVLWSHLGNPTCMGLLEQLHRDSLSWEIVHEGPGRSLVLAEF